MAEHTFPSDVVHHDWDRSRPPALTIDSGDVVHFDLRMAGHGQLALGDAYGDARFDFDAMYHLAGPIAVHGAAPGDTLQIDILELTPGAWGWTAMLPDLGLLPDDFPDGVLRTFPLDPGAPIDFAPGVAIPMAPFLGAIGTVPDVTEPTSPFPPHVGGGNVDTRHLVRGATLWLPVQRPHALLSVGDPHAAQGDGEVCVSALECPMRASLRITLQRRSIGAPRFTTPAPQRTGAAFGTMGIAPDLMEGARIATRAMIEWLGTEHGLEPTDAYLLCSLAGDLRIFELVDAGMWNVGMLMPLDLFER